ncbi:MAG: glycosyltransferase family 2 protein [Bacillota bacterium]
MIVQVIIVNYRTADLTVACLRSLAREALALCGLRVLVVDSCSGDGSAEQIAAAIEREGWSAWASILPLDRNGGYSAGNNAGIRLALAADSPAKYVLLLNPDTIVRPGALAELVRFMDQNPHVGIAGSGIEDVAAQPQCSAHRFPSPLGELLNTARLGILNGLMPGHVVSPPLRPEPHPCDWVSGASMVIRRQVFEQIGLMDEGYFLYYDEVDFCYRAHCAGWEVWYVPQAKVMHLEGAATGIRKERKRRPAYWYDSRRRFFIKAYGIGGLLLADALWIVGRFAWNVRRCLGLATASNDPRWFAWDLLVGDIRAILRERGYASTSAAS